MSKLSVYINLYKVLSIIYSDVTNDTNFPTTFLEL